MSQTEYIGRSSDTFPCNGVTVIANNIWNRLEREENIDMILSSSSKQKNNMVVDAKDLFLARAKILLAAVHMSTSTQWSGRSPLETRIGNKSNIIYSLKFAPLVTSPEDLPQTRVGVEEDISFHIDVGLHHRDIEVKVLRCVGIGHVPQMYVLSQTIY